jgi:hypothetical protein
MQYWRTSEKKSLCFVFFVTFVVPLNFSAPPRLCVRLFSDSHLIEPRRVLLESANILAASRPVCCYFPPRMILNPRSAPSRITMASSSG